MRKTMHVRRSWLEGMGRGERGRNQHTDEFEI
jgi:hypothetical protein